VGTNRTQRKRRTAANLDVFGAEVGLLYRERALEQFLFLLRLAYNTECVAEVHN
jgi:hypothetical protein